MNNPIRIKTFRSKTLQEAFQKIRTEFGPDASILETKVSRHGIFGNSRIEVTASSHSKTTEPDTSETSQGDSDILPKNDGRIPSDELTDQLSPPPAGNVERSEGKLKLRAQSYNSDYLEPESETAQDDLHECNDCASSLGPFPRSIRFVAGAPNVFAGPERVLGQVHQELMQAGIDPGIAVQWIDAARAMDNPTVIKDVWTLRSELLGWIRDMVHAAPPLALDDSRQRVLAFIGPPGAGKSTTLAKIAASLSMEHGLSVGILTTDTIRLGSNHLLHNYADVLGWRFEVAESIEQLPSCLANLAGCRFVLLDTSGCSPNDEESLERLRQQLELAKPNETHLVLSSTCNVRSFLRYEQAFEPLSPNRMILTRLDESGGLGPLFSCLQSSTVPVSYLTNGQKIPADLIQVTESRLAQRVMNVVD